MDRARLPHGDQSGLEFERDRRSEDEPARFDPRDLLDPCVPKRVSNRLGRPPEEIRIDKETQSVGMAVEILEAAYEQIVKVTHDRSMSTLAARGR